MKRNKKALGIYLWLSWGALLKPSQSSRLFISWIVAILRYLSMCKSKSFRDLPAAFFTLLLVNTQSSSPKRISSIQNNPFHEVCFSGKSSDHWWSPYSKPGLVAQCSLNLGKGSNQAGKAEVWGITVTNLKMQYPAQDPSLAMHFSIP